MNEKSRQIRSALRVAILDVSDWLHQAKLGLTYRGKHVKKSTISPSVTIAGIVILIAVAIAIAVLLTTPTSARPISDPLPAEEYIHAPQRSRETSSPVAQPSMVTDATVRSGVATEHTATTESNTTTDYVWPDNPFTLEANLVPSFAFGNELISPAIAAASGEPSFDKSDLEKLIPEIDQEEATDYLLNLDDPEIAIDMDQIMPRFLREMLAKLLYGEANCVKSLCEKSMVIWVVLNRLDSGVAWFGKTLEGIITKPYQFEYNETYPVTEESLALVDDVVLRWYLEKEGHTNVGRTIPEDIWFFHADSDVAGWHNYFYKMSGGLSGEKIIFSRDYPLSNPYEN